MSFASSKLPTHASFIHEGEFLGLEQLTRHLRDRHSLYMQYFVHAEDKSNYYAFLYKKEILSINLSIRSNLKSFAKIIQSFSRAKSLNIKNSQNLKDFLFEESEKSYQETFAAHKTELEKQLFDYKSLEVEIGQLESKQQSLVELKEMQEQAGASHLAYLGYKLRFESASISTFQTKYKQGLDILSDFHKECLCLEDRAPRLSGVLLQMKTDSASLKLMTAALRKFQEHQQQIDALTDEHGRLSACEAPEIGQIEASDVDIDDFHTDELLKRIYEFKSIFGKYLSLSAMSQKVAEQKNIIQEQRSSIEGQIKRSNDILSLIMHNKKDTLFSKILEQEKPLSEMQEAVLFGLLSTAWGKPDNPLEQSTYTQNLELLSEHNIEADPQAGGYWLELGHLRQYFPKLQQSRLFNDTGKLAEAFAKRQAEIETAIAGYSSQLAELEKFEKGFSFDPEIIKVDYDFDPQLKDFSAYQHFEKTAQLIVNLHRRFERIEEKKDILLEAQAAIEFPYKISKNRDAEYFENCSEQKAEAITRCTAQIAKEQSRLKSLKDDLIPVKSAGNETDQKGLEMAQANYIQTLSDFEKLYSKEQLAATEEIVISREDRTQQFSDANQKAKQDYVSEYKMVLSRFEDTAGSNMEIREQVREGKFSFHVLELGLLGPKIRYTDNIAENVRELNRVRLGIVDTIFETMLKIFVQTRDKYELYRTTVRDLNTFFKRTKISKKHYFQIHFVPQKDFSIDWIYQLQNHSTAAYKTGELAFSDITVENFVEDFFRSATGYRRRINFSELLDPKTYFALEAKLENEAGDKETPGSTGETYAAVVLLGIGRLSKVQTETRKGIKFIILEETANLDATNFSTFPDLANEHGYQIITMTPKPYGSDAQGGWILHHLIPGIEDTDINFPVSNSYFKTNTESIPLDQHPLTTSL